MSESFNMEGQLPQTELPNPAVIFKGSADQKDLGLRRPKAHVRAKMAFRKQTIDFSDLFCFMCQRIELNIQSMDRSYPSILSTSAVCGLSA